MEGEREYAFWHILVRDVCYGQIPRLARAGRHEAAAAWLEEQAGERVEDLADVLAYHYESFLVNDVTNLTLNNAKLPSEIIKGPMLGMALAIPRVTAKVGLRFSLDAINKLRGGEQPRKRVLDSLIEVSFLAAAIQIKREQCIDIRARGRPAVRMSR